LKTPRNFLFEAGLKNSVNQHPPVFTIQAPANRNHFISKMHSVPKTTSLLGLLAFAAQVSAHGFVQNIVIDGTS
jgi:hypothetical protein